MTKTFKITIGILILLALAAGGVFSVSRNKTKQKEAAQTTVANNTNEETTETSEEAEEITADDEIEEITADQDIDTSSWKTYRNEEYGFSFKYSPEMVNNPNELEVMNNSADQNNSYLFLSLKDKNGLNNNVEFNVYELTDSEKKITLEQFVDKTVKNSSSISPMTISNQKAVKVSFTKGSFQIGGHEAIMENNSMIFMEHDNYIIYIILGVKGPLSTENQHIFNQILSTLDLF